MTPVCSPTCGARTVLSARQSVRRNQSRLPPRLDCGRGRRGRWRRWRGGRRRGRRGREPSQGFCGKQFVWLACLPGGDWLPLRDFESGEALGLVPLPDQGLLLCNANLQPVVLIVSLVPRVLRRRVLCAG